MGYTLEYQMLVLWSVVRQHGLGIASSCPLCPLVSACTCFSGWCEELLNSLVDMNSPSGIDWDPAASVVPAMTMGGLSE